MSSGGTITFDMVHERPVMIHSIFGGLTLLLGMFLLVRWVWTKLYN